MVGRAARGREDRSPTTLMPESAAAQLMRAFHYSAADLEVNRHGRLSAHQVMRLVIRELRLWVLIAICAAVVAGLGWLLTTASNASNAQPFKAAVFLLIAFGVGIYLTVKAIRMFLDLVGGRVVSKSGQMEMITRVSDWDGLLGNNQSLMVSKYRFEPRSESAETEVQVIDRMAEEIGVLKSDLATKATKEELRRLEKRLRMVGHETLHPLEFGVSKEVSAELPKEFACTVYFTPRVKRLVGIDRVMLDRSHEVDRVAMAAAKGYENARGWAVRDVSGGIGNPSGLVVGTANDDVLAIVRQRAPDLREPRFDLLSTGPDGKSMRFIEVKGFSSSGALEIIEKERSAAAALGQDYWLYIVFDCESRPEVIRIVDPMRLAWEPSPGNHHGAASQRYTLPLDEIRQAAAPDT